MHFVLAPCLWVLVPLTAALSMPPTPSPFLPQFSPPALHPYTPCGQHMREAAERRQQLELEHEQALAVLNAKQQEIDILQKVRELQAPVGMGFCVCPAFGLCHG